MGNRVTDDWRKQLKYLQQYIGEEIAPEVDKLFKESVRYSLVDYYNDYDPTMYHRTYNFMNGVLQSVRTSGKGKRISMSVNSGHMDSYKGFENPPYPGYQNKTLQPSTAFDFFFEGGEHGHGKWMMHRSVPPFMLVDRDIEDGFDGRISEIIDRTIDKYTT